MPDGWLSILYPARLPTFHRLIPPESLQSRVRWFWVPQWDLPPGRISRQELLSFPAVNLVVEPTFLGVAGPTTRSSFRDLSGRGWTVGALLRPAAVPDLVPDPRRLRDTYQEFQAPELHRAVVAAMAGSHRAEDRPTHAVHAFATWLAARIPLPDSEALLANRLAELVESDASINRVDDLGERLGISTRAVQRLTARYIGLPPAAMIRRRRLQHAAGLLRTTPQTSTASIASELGYADQAHLGNDFRAQTGTTPRRYRNTSVEQAENPLR